MVIVESPTKARTIGVFLGAPYRVESSFGHVRDLPKSQLGVDVEHDFEPHYVVPKKAQKQVTLLKKEAAKADEIILATDEDREGEAIAYHLVEALKLKDKMAEGKVKRIVFHEITKSAIAEAVEHPRAIDENLVNAQQARRVLDRLVGYKLSPFLWKKVARGLSAGRVQSAAMRLIVEREEEIENFKPVEYYTVAAEMEVKGNDEATQTIRFELTKIDGKNISKPGITDKARAERAVAELKDAVYAPPEIKAKEMRKNPLPPFTTSTLQQTAANRLGFSAKKTMMLAQRLYERGHITYMRTDSVNLSREAVERARQYIADTYGNEYLPAAARRFTTKSKLAQEAHEAVRPTRVEMAAGEELEKDERRLYELIWRRFTASQMTPAVFNHGTITIATKKPRGYLLKVTGSTMKFDGFLKVWPTKFSEVQLPTVDEKAELKCRKAEAEQHVTEPPARYNEASLVKTLEEYGVGRPSTYASIISVIQERNYAVKNEQRRFAPTEMGKIVTKLLTENFPKIVDIGFTADVEEDFDEIALGVSNWREVIRNFYEPFAKRLAEKELEIKKEDIMPEEKTDEKCEKCGRDMVIKRGRYGKFLACSGFPECKNTKKLAGAAAEKAGGFVSQSTGIKCPECGEGELVSRRVGRGRARGKIFWGCSRYPKCKHAVWENPAGNSKS